MRKPHHQSRQYTAAQLRARSGGLTIVELILGAVIGLVVVSGAYNLWTGLTGIADRNKQTLATAEDLDSQLEYMTSEIEAAQAVRITDCEPIPSGYTLLYGLDIPPQAEKTENYTTGKGFVDMKSECEIKYLTRNGSDGVEVYRYGPTLGKDGYFSPVATGSSPVRVMNRISTTTPAEWGNCANGEIKRGSGGIQVCVDDTTKRYAELRAEMKYDEGEHRATKGAYTRLSKEQTSTAGGGGSPCIDPTRCQVGDVTLVSKRVTYLLDVSGSMGMRMDNGRTRIENAKADLIALINNLATDTYFNIYVFGSCGNTGRFRNAMVPMTGSNKNAALDYVRGLSAYDYNTCPFNQLNRMLQEDSVGQMIILSDGQIQSGGDSGTCFRDGRNGPFSNCLNTVNASRGTSPIRFDATSYGGNYCGNGWMGLMATQTRGSCKYVR